MTNDSEQSDPIGRRSVFWKVAGVLVGVQIATGLLAVGLSAWFAYDRSLNLVSNSLRLRLDNLAEEVEQRIGAFDAGLTNLPRPLRLDLSARFPDPVLLLDAEGRPVETIRPDAAVFGASIRLPDEPPPLPAGLGEVLRQGSVVIQLDGEGTSWGVAPVYDPEDFLVGGLLVQPLTNSLARELADTRAAFMRALVVAAALAGLIALLLGAFFTNQLVRPLRRMTRRVERIGAGDYASRLEEGHADEFGRLAAAINHMAEEVQTSIEALRATDQLRRELIANVGHDLRTPLAAMLGYAEEAERLMAEGRREEAEASLETARRQGHYLQRLVEDLFELSLLDSAREPLRREPIPLAELLHDAAGGHRAAFEKASITFQIDVASGLPLIEGDGVRLLRLVDNLLSNARRHTPAGGMVRLQAEHKDGQVIIRLQDSGEGMSPETLAHVFERYYRGRGARTRLQQGTGLGLPIARAIAHAHNGELLAESTPGQGSTFTLTLPV